MTTTRNLLAAFAVASALTLGTLSPALAATEHEPTTAEATAALASADQSADQLEGQAKRAAATRDDVQADLAAAAAVAATKLEAYALAVRAQEQAVLAEDAAQAQLQQAQQVLTARKAQLGQWVRITYQQGLGLQGDPAFSTLLSTRSADAGTTLNVLRRLGQDQVSTLRDVEAANATQRKAADAAATASQQATVLAVKAGAAKQAADAALAQQRSLLADADAAVAATGRSLVAARVRDSLISGVGATPAPGTGPGTGTGTGTGRTGTGVTGKVGSCKGGQITLYQNGRIPISALCPLWASSTQYLRADAAYAFNRLSKAYTVQFGSAPCMTDSYRTYQEQVRLFTVKPGLAAKPGTSNHGWGTAVDLCGGIQSYGTATYRWMMLNAPLYGWFHPSWARQGGGREEPWHWEFSG